MPRGIRIGFASDYRFSAESGAYSHIGPDATSLLLKSRMYAEYDAYSIAGSDAALTPDWIDGPSMAQFFTVGFDRATPEQISIQALLVLPTPLPAPLTTVVSVRTRISGSSTWVQGHPLTYVHAQSGASASFPVPASFAGCVWDLIPGQTYDVELTLSNHGGSPVVGVYSATTRALPAASGAATKFATPATLNTVLATLVPGDVLELADGTYPGRQLNNINGSLAAPIYIRGASRTGTIISGVGLSTPCWYILACSHIVFERMTLLQNGIDTGTASTTVGISLWSGAIQTNLTFRNMTITGSDRGLVGSSAAQGILVYNCEFIGNNLWTYSNIRTGDTFNDDGICIPGYGNCAWNNTLEGFGDAFAVKQAITSISVHFYRNWVKWSGDDIWESDYATRNCSFYDNYSANVPILMSSDSLYGGPIYAFRNVCINTTRGPYKLNTSAWNILIYNNTICHTSEADYTPSTYGAYGTARGMYISGPPAFWGLAFRNNMLVYRGTGTGLNASNTAGTANNLVRLDFDINNPVDFDHNAWYPNTKSVQWNGGGWNLNYASMTLAAAGASTPVTVPRYGTATKVHQNDVVTTSNPWVGTVTLGANQETLFVGQPDMALVAGSAAKGAGVSIPGITDGATGAPDIGAVITGRARVQYGDQSNPAWPAWRSEMTALTWRTIPGGTKPTLHSVNPANDPLVNPSYNPAYAVGNNSSPSPWQGVLGQGGLLYTDSGAAYDYDTDEMWYVCSGGHDDYAGNEVYKVNLRGAATEWARVQNPTGCIGNEGPLLDTVGSPNDLDGLYRDGKPKSHHTVGAHVYVPGLGTMMVARPVPWASGNSGFNPWIAAPGTGALSVYSGFTTSGYPASGVGPSAFIASALDTSRNCVWTRVSAANNFLRKLDLTTRVSSAVGGVTQAANSCTNLTYLPEYDALVSLCSTTGNAALYTSGLQGMLITDPATGANYRGVISGSFAPGWTIRAHNGVAWDGTRFLMWDVRAGATGTVDTRIVNTLTPPATGSIYTGTWTAGFITPHASNTVTPTGSYDAVGPNGTKGRWRYSPFLKGCVLLNYRLDPYYFFATE